MRVRMLNPIEREALKITPDVKSFLTSPDGPAFMTAILTTRTLWVRAIVPQPCQVWKMQSRTALRFRAGLSGRPWKPLICSMGTKIGGFSVY